MFKFITGCLVGGILMSLIGVCTIWADKDYKVTKKVRGFKVGVVDQVNDNDGYKWFKTKICN